MQAQFGVACCRGLLGSLLVISLSILAGCDEKTGLLIEVASSDFTIPADLNRLRFEVVGQESGERLDQTHDVSSDWPHSLLVEPGSNDNEGVSISVTGLLETLAVAQETLSSRFIRGNTQKVQVNLGTGATDGDADADGDRDADEDSDTNVREDSDVDENIVECHIHDDCDDDVQCTVDTCDDFGTCTNTPDDSLCVAGTECDPETDCPPRECELDIDCRDSLDCNGTERCDDGECIPGDSIDCDDGNDCSDDVCSEFTSATCLHTTRDRDSDGYGDDDCAEIGGVPATDCADDDDTIYPGAPEDCNGVDDDCNGETDEIFTCVFGTSEECLTSCGTTGTKSCDASCDWTECEPPVEICNFIDDDCDGDTDEGCLPCGRCVGATTVSAPGGRYSVTLHGHALRGSCGGAGSEAYLTFTLTSISDVFITTHGAGLDTVVYVRQCRCNGLELACNDDADGMTTSTVQLTSLPPGLYNVIIDSHGTVSSTIDVDINISEAGSSGDRCGQPRFIPSGTVSISGETCGATPDYQPYTHPGRSCATVSSGAAADLVYYFYLSSSETVTFNACNTFTDYNTTIYVRDVCPDDSDTNQIGCAEDGCGGAFSCFYSVHSELTTIMGPGLFYVFIDGFDLMVLPCPCGNFLFDISMT